MSHQISIFDNPQPSFHNQTIGLKGTELKKAEKAAKSQEEIVLNLFEQFPHAEFNAYTVYLRLGQQIREGSIRRCLTNLLNKGVLIETGKRDAAGCQFTNKNYKLNENKSH